MVIDIHGGKRMTKRIQYFDLIGFRKPFGIGEFRPVVEHYYAKIGK